MSAPSTPTVTSGHPADTSSRLACQVRLKVTLWFRSKVTRLWADEREQGGDQTRARRLVAGLRGDG
jgi:hypothetical protein